MRGGESAAPDRPCLMRGVTRVRRRLSTAQRALIVQSLGWLIAAIESIHQADRTEEETALLTLAKRARSWVSDAELD